MGETYIKVGCLYSISGKSNDQRKDCMLTFSTVKKGGHCPGNQRKVRENKKELQ